MALAVLTRRQTFDVLIASEPEIRALGVSRLALFGSVLRDQARADSDVDLLVQFTPGAKTYAHFLELSELLEQLLGRPVGLVTTDALSPFIGPRILAEAQEAHSSSLPSGRQTGKRSASRFATPIAAGCRHHQAIACL